MWKFKHSVVQKWISVGGREMQMVRTGLRTRFWQDIYFYTMTMSWLLFFAFYVLFFLALNVLFAGLLMLGDNPVANMPANSFLNAFYFSVETLATVGYGDMHPQTNYGHVIATIEILIGTLSLALITGIMFARFSRPRSSVLFAEHPVSHQSGEHRYLMIRIANSRMNVISEASAKLRFIRDEITPFAGPFRKILDLKLVRDQHPNLILGWTLIHIIDQDSPLFQMTPESLAKANAALILSIEGVDETTNQTQRARNYYDCALIRWNHRYVDIFSMQQGSVQHVDHTKFHRSEEVAMLEEEAQTDEAAMATMDTRVD